MAPRAKSKASGSGSSSSADAVSAAHADLTRTRKQARKTKSVGAHASARVGLISGLIEGTMAIMELMFGLTMSRAACLAVYRAVNSLPEGQDPPVWNLFCISMVANLVTILWFIFRMSQKSQPTCSMAQMADRLNLWPLPRRLSSDSASMLLRIFCLHFIGTSGMFLAQYMSGQWIFSWQNYWSAEKGWDYSNAVDMLLMAPLREELVFRGLMFAIFYLRGAAFKVTTNAAPAADTDAASSTSAKAPKAVAAGEGEDDNGAQDGAVVPAAAAAIPSESMESLAWTSSWKLDCVFASAVTFGLVHLLNLFGSRYTRTYIVLQVFLGMTLGAFYCLRFVLSDNCMLETVALHVINNVFSSFLPVEAELDLASPLVSLPLLLTFVVYGSLAYGQYKKLMATPPKPFTVLLPQVEATATATAAPAVAAEQDNEAKEQ